MIRGSLAEDPREGLSSSSRYSRMGGEKNSLLYVDSSSVRKARKAAENKSRATGGAAKGDHNFTSKKSVGRGHINSHMDRLEVASDGRLFHVKENSSRNASEKQSVKHPANQKSHSFAQKASQAKTAEVYTVQHADMPAAVVSEDPAVLAAKPQALLLPAAPAAKPVRPYLASDYRNPLLAPSAVKVNMPSGREFFRKYRIPLLAALAAAAAAFYGYTAWHYSSRFYPGTQFFGISASEMSVWDVKAAVKSKVDSYTLELVGRDPAGSKDESSAAVENLSGPEDNVITAEDVGLRYVDDGAIDRAMDTQKSWAWPVMMIVRAIKGQEQELETSFDRESVPEVLSSLAVFSDENIIQPENAKITLTDDGAVVTSEIYGTKLKSGETAEEVIRALELGKTEINLDQAGLYESPTVFSGDILLMTEAQALNKVLGAKITMPFGDHEEVINSEVIRTFLSKRDGSYYVDEEKVQSYVAGLAETYDTLQKARTFYTSMGTTVELEEGTGDYGWKLDQESTYEQLLDAVRAQKQTTLEPVWIQDAYSGPVNDLGDTYVEICLTTQTMWFYKNGELIVKTPVVTGNPYAGNATPSGGVWSIKNRMRNALLSGEGYTAPVDYWMPFNGGVGIHDLQSRYWFGGNVYLGGGSHGCINTPLSAVKLIYESIETGVPVIVYEDESEKAMSEQDGPYDSGSLKTLIEETYGTVEDDGKGSIVWWTAQSKTQTAAAQTASSAAQSGTTAAQSTSQTGGNWQ